MYVLHGWLHLYLYLYLYGWLSSLATGLCHDMRKVRSVRHDAGRLSKNGGHHAIPRQKLL